MALTNERMKRIYVSPIAEPFMFGSALHVLGTLSLDGGVGEFEPGDPGNINEDVWDDYVDNP